MRILTTLSAAAATAIPAVAAVTAVVAVAAAAALAGLSSSSAYARASDSRTSAPCTPHATVWTWPLDGDTAGRDGTAETGQPTGQSAGQPTPSPTVLRPFEPPRHRWDAGHRGVDLAGYGREPVLAAHSGTVLYAGFLVDRPVVVVGHGLLRTTYEPVVPDPSIHVGVQVTRGQRIGTLLAGHCASLACLHWGLVSGHGHAAVYYDPLLLLGCGAVRLEPDERSGGEDDAAGIRSGPRREPARMVRQ